MAVKNKRECGECTACCEVMIVPELQKPANNKCVYANNGCSMYEHRPPTCRDWNCLWVQGRFGNKERPDKTKFVSWIMPSSQSAQWGHPVVAIREIKEGSSVVPAGDRAIKKLTGSGASVIVIKRDTGRVIHPARGFKDEMKLRFDQQKVEYSMRGGRFYLSKEYCEKVWPIDYANKENLKELIQIS